MGKWWRANAELRRKAAIVVGLLWAFGALPTAVVLFNLGEGWAWTALLVAVAPFLIVGAGLMIFIAAAPFLARTGAARAIALAVSVAIGSLIFERPLLTALYAAAVVIAWFAIELWQSRQPVRR